MSKHFNWDSYIQTASYRQIQEGMFGVRKFMPTMLSPDRKKIYLVTLDIECETDDVDSLNMILKNLYRDLVHEFTSISDSLETAYLHQVDYLAVWKVLFEKNALPEDYECPEYYLKKAWEEAGYSKPLPA